MPDRTPLARLLEMQWMLHGSESQDARPRDISINAIPFRIGRRVDLNLSLKSKSVSGLHAEFVLREDKLVLKELGSTNGTFVNGERLQGETVLRVGDLIQFADLVFRLDQIKDSFETETHRAIPEEIPPLSQVDQLIRDKSVTPHFQPIVDLKTTTVTGYELLSRSALAGLETPYEMFRAAAKVQLQAKLSSVCRWKGTIDAQALPGDPTLFVNIHRDEELMTDVLGSLTTLRESFPHQKYVVEIHEAAVPGPTQMESFQDALRDLDMQLAFDDFGVGESRLMDLVRVPPDVLKFDISLIREIDRATDRHLKWLRNLIDSTHDLGILALAEGIENASAAVVCRDLGFDSGQGYHFGRPRKIDEFTPKRTK